ncbi:TLC domain-containing protein [Fragilaria crotonensis]|nr:TLC domain-containing protein [Fragilaria crotonensis]
MATYQEEYEVIKAIHESHPMFVEWDHVRNDLIPGVVRSAFAISLVFALAAIAMSRLTPEGSTSKIFKSAYNVTNLLVNTTLGIMGLYYYHYVIDSNLPPEQRVLGYKSIFTMTCVQFGYNLWAIPVGLLLVNESPAMLCHHVAVLFVTSVSALFTTGHRWYVPFMYGILELSSVPLAIMNAFKDNPEYIKKFPSAYACIRIIFGVSFLYIRWYLYLPLKYDFLRSFGFTVITHRTPFAVVVTGLTWCASFFLLLLQLMWGCLIIKGLVKGLQGKPKNAKKKEE